MGIVYAIGGAGCGLIAGSFLATLAIRWGRHELISRGRSRCDHCHVQLAPLRLIPLASFVQLKGRCARCRRSIDWRHPAMESLCAVIGVVGMGIWPAWEGLAGALFGWLLATLALLDLDHLWLPDRLVLPLGIVGVASGFAGIPPSPVDRLVGAGAGYATLAGAAWAYRRVRGRTGMGGGDPKFFGAIGAWLGWAVLPFVLMTAAGLGLCWCLGAVLRGRSMSMSDRLPFGPFLAVAAWLMWLVRSALPG